MNIAPPLTPLDRLDDVLRADGVAIVGPSDVARLARVTAADLASLARHWDELPLDPHLRDGGRYRRRRHGSLIVEPGTQGDSTIVTVPHRPHWQPVEYNALHGGILRSFAPIEPAMLEAPAMRGLVLGIAAVADRIVGRRRWYVEAHPFRIDTEGGIGRPTPEGAHRDGVDWVAVVLVSRVGVRGGESRVFEADGPRGQRFLLSEPWTLLLLDDARVIHETTPVQPLSADAPRGHRDTLVVTLRAGGFQSPAPDARSSP
jgi:hypothetical protein